MRLSKVTLRRGGPHPLQARRAQVGALHPNDNGAVLVLALVFILVMSLSVVAR